VVAVARSGSGPSLDEYVVARGPDLLHTAWLLTGDMRRARELVQAALASLWRRPSRAPHWGEGSLDAAARQAVVARYVGRWGRADARRSDRNLNRTAGTDGTNGSDGTDGILAALAGLSRLQRAVVVLRYAEGLDDGQVGDVVGRRARTVRTERVRALAQLGQVPALVGHDADTDVADALRHALLALEDSDPGPIEIEGLAEGTRRYAAHARRVRSAAIAGGVVVVVAVGALVAVTVDRDRSARLAAKPPALTCRELPTSRATPRAGGAPLSTRARAALVCPDRTELSIWPGSLPPDEPLTDRAGLDYLVLVPPVAKDAHCPRLPVGPAFTITVQGKDGRSATYDNVDLACNGWPALDRYFIALGEQEAAASFDPRVDPFPPCPATLGHPLRPRHDGPPGIPKGTVFTAASTCVHQSPDPTQVPVFRRPIRAVLGDPELAALTHEAATHGSGPTAVGCDDSVPSSTIIVVRAVTSQGDLVELTGSRACGLELLVNWSPGDYWTVSRATADAVAGDFGGFPR
jgi:DNA-directed RNA polymerase specialized sigma24 family protein